MNTGKLQVKILKMRSPEGRIPTLPSILHGQYADVDARNAISGLKRMKIGSHDLNIVPPTQESTCAELTALLCPHGHIVNQMNQNFF